MTITTKPASPKPSPLTFPRVMKYSTPEKQNGAKVLFFDYKTGIVLESSDYPIGSFKDSWAYCENSTDWVHVPNQKVTIVTD